MLIRTPQLKDLEYPKPPLPVIDHSLVLPSNQYIDQVYPKKAIVLHHTVGGSARSTYEWWRGNAERVGTAYLIDRDGTVYEVFSPDRWAYHLGTNDLEAERTTIGIELCSEGALVPVGGELHAFYNPQTGRGRTHKDPVVDLERTWRGYRYFDAYSDEQVIALLGLVDLLCDRFDIPRRCPEDPWEYDPKWLHFSGIYSHSHVRKDKSDVHPLQLWEPLKKYCKVTTC